MTRTSTVGRYEGAGAPRPLPEAERRPWTRRSSSAATVFWEWAIVQTLRHTGIRIEGLELTQLSIRQY